jgi:gamma-glutamyltranspeptidase/glutathione hydrolase
VIPVLACAAIAAGVLSTPVLARPTPPPAAAQRVMAPPATAGQAMVAAANPLAVEAGLKVLRAGGSAVDAAVAVQAVLGLVEPQSSGLGGGAFMTFYDARTGRVSAYNGRETAPAGARPDMFMGPDGRPVGFVKAVLGGHSTGTPGAVAMLALAQKEHGRLAWRDLFGDAHRLAVEGFTVTPRLAGYVNGRAPQAGAPDAVAFFTKADGTRIQVGDRLKNPAYGETIERLAAEGPDAIYRGRIAADISASVQAASPPGALSAADLAAYRPKQGAALCRPYHAYLVCMPPPPAGGVSVLEALGILANTDIAARGPGDPQAWYELAEAQRLVYADRDLYVGDPDFVQVPTDGLLDPAYLRARAALIGPTAGPAPTAGTPPGARRRGPDSTTEPGGTSHFVIVDAKGNVVSMTTTVESIFGSGRMTHGFFLNNQMTDFAFRPTGPDGAPAANAVAPGKRPRSAMSPTIVLDGKGRFVAAVGSPGGQAIIAYDLKALVGILDWKLSMQDAIALPNLIAKGANYSGEVEKFPPAVLAGLKARGVEVRAGQGEDSGLHGVMVKDGRLTGGADPRREGVAKGLD